jgi:hypothetical protein
MKAEDLTSYASRFNSGHVAMAIVNKKSSTKVVEVDFMNHEPGDRYFWYTLEGGTGKPFSRQVIINGNRPDYVAGGPSDYKEIPAFTASTQNGIKIEAPGHSVVFLLIEPN